MSGHFILTLDIDQPIIQIYSPRYTTKEESIEVSVVANETLNSGFQNFYVIDGNGARHNVVFSYSGNEFIGEISFSNFDNGIVMFYAQVEDEVGNLSPLVSKAIEIIPSVNYLRLNMEINTSEWSISSGEKQMNTTTSIEENMYTIESSVIEMEHVLNTDNRVVILSEQDREQNITTEVVI